MILDWGKIWNRYEEFENNRNPQDEEDTLWKAIEEQTSITDEYRLQIDEMWNQLLEWYVGEKPADGVDYELAFEDKLELQGAMQGAVELALRLQQRDFEVR